MPLPVPRDRLNTLEARGQWCASTTDHGSCGGDSECAYCSGSDRGMPVPQIMLVSGGGTACAVYIPQVQFLDKVVCARCCSTTGAGS